MSPSPATWARWFLALALLAMALFAARHHDNLRIDTDLTSLAPDVALSPLADRGVARVAENIQRRAVFLLSSPTAAETDAAARYLESALAPLSGVKVVDRERQLAAMQAFFTTYRFQLLTPEQRRQLQSQTPGQLARGAIQSRYSLSANPQVLPFAADPLGWHSGYVLDTVSVLGGDDGELPETMAAVNASIDIDALAMDGQSALAETFIDLEQALAEQFPTVVMRRSGVFFYAVNAAQDSRRDITRITSVSAVAITLLLLLTFRSPWALAVPLFSVVAGVGFAFAATHLAFGGIHIITIVFGASLIGVVIDYSLHYFFHSAQPDGHSARHLHRALLLSLATSLVGYSALALSRLDVLAQVAVFSCAGLAMAMVVVIALCPLAAGRLRVRQRAVAAVVDVLASPWRRCSRQLAAGLALALVFAGAGSALWLLESRDDPSLFLAPDQELLAMDRFIAARLDQYEPGTFVLVEGESTRQVYDSSAAFFSLVDDSDVLQAEDFVSITSVVPAPDQQRDNYRLQAGLYGEGGAVEEFARQLQVPERQREAIQAAYLDAQGRVATPPAFLDAAADSLPPLWYAGQDGALNIILLRKGVDLAALQALLQEVPAARYYRAIDATTAALRHQKSSAVVLLAGAYGLVALFLLWFYRRRSALLVVVVPLCATAAVLLAFGIGGVAFNLFHVMALFLALGLGLDYGIFVYEMRARAVMASRAVAVSAATSVLSFGLLAASNIPVVQSFGLTLLIANCVNFFGAMLLAQQLNSPSGKLQS